MYFKNCGTKASSTLFSVIFLSYAVVQNFSKEVSRKIPRQTLSDRIKGKCTKVVDGRKTELTKYEEKILVDCTVWLWQSAVIHLLFL